MHFSSSREDLCQRDSTVYYIGAIEKAMVPLGNEKSVSDCDFRICSIELRIIMNTCDGALTNLACKIMRHRCQPKQKLFLSPSCDAMAMMLTLTML